jgi:hypothetical protein
MTMMMITTTLFYYCCCCCSSSNYTVTHNKEAFNDWMIVNNELERMRKEEVIA